MALCCLAKSSMCHQPPGTAFWMAFQLDLAGNAVSDLGRLQDLSGKRGVAELHVFWLHEFCRRDGAWVVPPAWRVYSAEWAWWCPVAVQHCPGELFCTGRMVLDLAAPHCAASRLCIEPRWPQCGLGFVLVPMAFASPQRPNRPWPVSATLDVRDEWCHYGRRTGRTP